MPWSTVRTRAAGGAVLAMVTIATGVVAGPLPLPAAAQSEPGAVLSVPHRQPPAWLVDGEGWFAPGGRNEGTQQLIERLVAIALHENAPLYHSDTWGRSHGHAGSDHHASQTTSWAADLAVAWVNEPTAATERAAARIAAALGAPAWPGGDLVTVIEGYRFQLLWLVPGHFDHVHVGVRKLA